MAQAPAATASPHEAPIRANQPVLPIHRKKSGPAAWFILAQLAAVAGLAYHYAPLRLDLGDEGFLAHCADRVMHGEFPHRDFYSLQGPLSHFFMAGWASLWGLSFFKFRIAGVLIQCAVAVLTFLIARQANAGRWAYAAGAGAVLAGPLYNNYAPLAVWQGIALSLLAVWLVLRSVNNGDRRLAALSGSAASLSILCRHDQGAYLVMAIAALALAQRFVPRETGTSRFRIGAWLLGALAVALPAFVICWWLGALPSMWEQMVLFPLTRYGLTSGIPMPWLDQEGPAGSPLAILVFRLSPIIAAVSCASILWNSRKRGYGQPEAIGLYLVAFTMFFYFQVLTRSDLAHLVLTWHPLLILLAWLPNYMKRTIASAIRPMWPRNQAAMLVTGGATLAFTFVLASGWHLLRPEDAGAPRTLQLAHAGVRVDAVKADMIERTVGTMQMEAGPDESVLVLPYEPGLYVLAERRNPTRWGYHWKNDRTDQEQQELIAQAMRDAPAVVVLFDRDETATYLGPVVQWIEEHYAAIDAQADPVIYRPRTR